MRAVVFVGPSVDAATVRSILPEVEVQPPVCRGDVDALFGAEEPPTHIGIIDGQFFQSLSISPKEILRAMDDHGTRVYGASSMGALRAAELAEWGMTGIGKVFELYHSGAVDADDEVAITFDPDTLTAQSEPLINLRVALAAAVDRDVVTAATASLTIETAKRLYFPERATQRVLHELADAIPEDERDHLRRYLTDEAPDAKRDDAVALVERMRLDTADASGHG